MITIKSKEEIRLMRKAGKIVGDTLKLIEDNIKVGMTTQSLDALAYDYIKKCGAEPSFLGYDGYPASICVSIDDEVVHGIPGKRVILEGQIVSVDIGAFINGYHGDAARTFMIGRVASNRQKLVKVCEESFFEGVKAISIGGRIGDISNAIQTYVESNGYSVVRELVGHGIGREMHEDPNVPNYGKAGHGYRLEHGMTIAIEPMINLGARAVEILEDGWTVVTVDGSPSAHYENTVAITDEGVEILTL